MKVALCNPSGIKLPIAFTAALPTGTPSIWNKLRPTLLNAGSVTVSDTSETVDLFTYNGGSVTGQIISISGYTYYVADGLTTTIASILYGDVPIGLQLEDAASTFLINRNLLTRFKVSVNPNRKFVLSDWSEKGDETDEID